MNTTNNHYNQNTFSQIEAAFLSLWWWEFLPTVILVMITTICWIMLELIVTPWHICNYAASAACDRFTTPTFPVFPSMTMQSETAALHMKVQSIQHQSSPSGPSSTVHQCKARRTALVTQSPTNPTVSGSISGYSGLHVRITLDKTAIPSSRTNMYRLVALHNKFPQRAYQCMLLLFSLLHNK